MMNTPELGVLNLVLKPEVDCLFTVNPARSLHAAILRRIELASPELSKELHDEPARASSIEKPWTVSSLRGPLEQKGKDLGISGGAEYAVRITTLSQPVMQVLQSVFDPSLSLWREPLILEKASFHIQFERCGWEKLSTYAALLNLARPYRKIALDLLSPTGFRTHDAERAWPQPYRCIHGYLRKWNAFSGLPVEGDDILEYVQKNISMIWSDIKPDGMNYREFYVKGWTGKVEWRVGGDDSGMIRVINALVDYSMYCGTGRKTTQGMGQTVRIFE